MRILHIIQRYQPARGGAENHLAEISRYLAGRGHEVTIATTDALDFELFWDPKQRRLTEQVSGVDGVQVLRFPVAHLPLSPLSYPALRRGLWLMSANRFIPVAWLERAARFTPWVPQLWHWLQTTTSHFDLVAGMTICFEPLLTAGLHFAHARGLPFVSYPLTHFGAGSRPGQDSLSRFYTMRHQVATVLGSDAIVAQTETERTFFRDYGYPAERIITAGPGIDPAGEAGGDEERFRQKHGIRGPMILALGSMSADKGTVDTVKAVQQLWQAGEAVELVLIGAVLGPFQRFLDRLPEAVRRRLRLLGPVSDEEKRDALAACTMMSLPSRTDSFGIAYLEAWLYGKPVIGAHTWGVNTVIVDGENGLLVPFGEPTALAAALRDLLAVPGRAAAMGASGRELVLSQHTWAQKVVLSEALYASLL